MARLKDKYVKDIMPALQKEFGYTNVMAIPKLDKVIINIGLGEAVQNDKAVDAAVGDLTIVSGQKPLVTRAKKSIAGFKLREGMPIGVKVTLRGERMSLSIDYLALPFHVYVTFMVYLQRALMVVVIIA